MLLEEKIKDCLEQIRPFLQRDGGDVEFIRYIEEEKTVWVRLQGHCAGCPHAQETIKGGIESILRDQFPDNVELVEAMN